MKRVKVEIEEPTPRDVRRVGVSAEGHDLAFGDLQPMPSAMAGLGLSAARPETTTSAMQTDYARDFSDRDNVSVYSSAHSNPDDPTLPSFAEPVAPGEFEDIDYGGRSSEASDPNDGRFDSERGSRWGEAPF